MFDYSIHTYELLSCVSSDEYKRLQTQLSKFNPSIKLDNFIINDKHCHMTTYSRLHLYGIIRLKLLKIIHKNNAFRKICLYIVVNPYNTNYDLKDSNEKIIEPDDIDAAMNIIENRLRFLLPDTVRRRLTLNRLDFCLNLYLPTQEQAEEYIKLLKKGIPCKALKEKKIFDHTGHRYRSYENGILLECGSYSLEIYSKYIQMLDCHLKDPQNASGIVRIELRAHKQKLQQLAGKYDLISPKEDYWEFLIKAPLITKKEIPSIISKMVGKANFRTYQYNKERIMTSDYNDRTIELMIQIIDYFSSHSVNQNLLQDLNMTHADWKKNPS